MFPVEVVAKKISLSLLRCEVGLAQGDLDI